MIKKWFIFFNMDTPSQKTVFSLLALHYYKLNTISVCPSLTIWELMVKSTVPFTIFTPYKFYTFSGFQKGKGIKFFFCLSVSLCLSHSVEKILKINWKRFTNTECCSHFRSPPLQIFVQLWMGAKLLDLDFFFLF